MSNGFWAEAAADPSRIALVSPAGHGLTAGELLAACNRASHVLSGLGLRRGDTVAVLLPNDAPFIETYLAAMQSGLYFTPINWHLKPDEVAYILEDSGATALVADARYGDVAAAAARAAGIPAAASLAVGPIDGFTSYGDAKAAASPAPPDDRTAGNIMLYTGGTTGRPKAVRRPLMDASPDVVGSMMAFLASIFGIAPGPGAHLVTGPLYHSAPLAFGCMLSFHVGHAVVMMDRWDPEAALAAIEQHRITSTHMVPTMFHRLLALPQDVRARYDVSTLQSVIHGAAPCPPAVKQRMMDWWGPVLWEYYAGTEGGGTIASPQEWLAHPGTVGTPMIGCTVVITDDDGTPCPPGVEGTVWMSSLAGEFEYLGDAEKTRSAWRGDLFTLGDVGYLDEDGRLFLCDRKIDMIISGGVNIYPAEVEAELLSHPAVADAAVFGIPDDEWGEQVKAAVELERGYTPDPELEAELIAFCRERIAHFKCPRSVDFHDDLPRNEMGKLTKRALREAYWRDRERAI